MTDHAARLASIEARLNAATPGPWEWVADDPEERRSQAVGHVVSVQRDELIIQSWSDEYYTTAAHVDADLIAHAPADLRYLLDRVRELEAAERQARATYAETDGRFLTAMRTTGGPYRRGRSTVRAFIDACEFAQAIRHYACLPSCRYRVRVNGRYPPASSEGCDSAECCRRRSRSAIRRRTASS